MENSVSDDPAQAGLYVLSFKVEPGLATSSPRGVWLVKQGSPSAPKVRSARTAPSELFPASSPGTSVARPQRADDSAECPAQGPTGHRGWGTVCVSPRPEPWREPRASTSRTLLNDPGQRIGDAGVEHLHECGHRHHHAYEPGIDYGRHGSGGRPRSGTEGTPALSDIDFRLR